MTTIVADQQAGFIAADRMAVANDGEVCIECPKIRIFEFSDGRHLVASAGNEGPATIFEDWYENGDWDTPPDPMDGLDEADAFTTVILTPREGLFIADKFMRMYRIHDRWYGAGSGGVIAWSILKSGAAGIDLAMATAIDMDPNSGMGWDVVYVDGD